MRSLNPANVTYDVLVIGAGVAGIAAAHHLLSQSRKTSRNLSLRVIEASEYIGGRVRSIPWDSCLQVNVGAHWVVGEGPHHPLQPLLEAARCSPNGLDRCMPTNFEPEDVQILMPGGSVMTYDWRPIQDAFEMIEGMSQGEKERLSLATALNQVGWTPKSVGDHIALWFFCDYEWGLSPSETPVSHTVPAPYSKAFQSDVQMFMATDGGCTDLLRPLLAELPLDVISVGERALSIVQERSGVLTIHTDRGQYSARQAILTVSLNVLASGSISLTPPLQAERQILLQSYKCMAQYEVIIVEFSERFWARYFSEGKTCLLYAGEPRMLLHDLSPYYGRPMMEFHLAGDEAVRMATQPAAQTQSEIMEILRSVFGTELPTPSQLYCTSWSSNPFTLGAFSVRPHGMTEQEHASLRRPCMDGRLHFAGDGLHDVHTGYLHAAYLSGLDAAEKILDSLGPD